jgi:spermidine synthase
VSEVVDSSLSTPSATSPRVRRLVYAAAFGSAACGLAYELVLTALGGSLIGDTLVQTSLVISTMVFAMGVGALVAKRFLSRAAAAFVVCEPLVALLGGLAPVVLLASFSWMDVYEPVLIVIAFAIGTLVGAEVPLLLALIPDQREGSFAELLAADYIGALAAGVSIPFFIVPKLGLVTGSMVIGLVNLVMGIIVLVLLGPHGPSRGVRWLAGGFSAFVAVVLVAAMIGAPRFERSARQELFDDPIVFSEQSSFQEIVLTEEWRPAGERDTRLFLNGDLQFSSIDEYRYHEALVHPAMAGAHKRVLIMGGGDGLGLREVLKYRDVEEAVLVELDPAVVKLAKTHPIVKKLNQKAFDDPRVKVVSNDAFRYLRKLPPKERTFDVIIADFPDPDSISLAKLYSSEIYAMASRSLAPNGRIVVQSGSPTFARDAFWCIKKTVESTGLKTVPYHVDVPSFGDWGFVLASRNEVQLRLDPKSPKLRSLDTPSLVASAAFAPDRGPRKVNISTLGKPSILTYQRGAWRHY